MVRRRSPKESLLDLPVPPAGEIQERLHLRIPPSLKWRAKLHLMYLESAGEGQTLQQWVTGLIESELSSVEATRAGRKP